MFPCRTALCTRVAVLRNGACETCIRKALNPPGPKRREVSDMTMWELIETQDSGRVPSDRRWRDVKFFEDVGLDHNGDPTYLGE